MANALDLFSAPKDLSAEPLAARMRPRNLDEYIGQEHIVGKGRLLRRAIQADQLSSVIFYGPPGTGKTTLARVIANHTKSNFITLNAVLSGVQQIRDAIANADEQRKLYNKKTILFVDEVHRWNKGQQDALLPWVENGTIILIGATTENPFFEVNKALVSRSRVFQLKPLLNDDLLKAAQFALKDKERGYGNLCVQFEEGALSHLVETANGDARNLLNALQLAVETTEKDADGVIRITKQVAEESIQKKVVLYDRDGDYHYDIISAFIKSLRGRDPDGALYWLARMISAGEDPHFIFRRMLISACEDTGLADPFALGVVESCASAFDRIGLPEGRFMLTQAVLYLATAPKSNSTMAFFDALSTVEKENAEVPNHLKDASRDGEGFGHGEGYMYPHAYKDHWVAQQYLPDGLVGRVFYTPSEQGYEKKIRDDVLSRRELQIASILENTQSDVRDIDENWWQAEHLRRGTNKKQEQLTYSPPNKAFLQWQKRTEENRSETLLAMRNTLVARANLARHSRNLVLKADDGLFVWELLRQSPEGVTVALCTNADAKNILCQYGKTLSKIERPVFVNALDEVNDVIFDNVFVKNPFASKDGIEPFLQEYACNFDKNELFAKDATLHIVQSLPAKGMRLANVIERIKNSVQNFYTFDDVALQEFARAETFFYDDDSNNFFNWDICTIKDLCVAKGLSIDADEKEFFNKKLITKDLTLQWFDEEKSLYARTLAKHLDADKLQLVKNFFAKLAERESVVEWKTTVAFLRIQKL